MFYEVFVRSYADSDADGIGDLRGLLGRLDYLNDGDASTTDDLGVTGIWLMPVAESPSYHGYDVVDARAVERDYGSLDDMRALVTAAHSRGIAVITDLVLNHTSDQNPWFIDSQTPGSPHDDWYVWAPDDPGYGGPDGQTVWHASGNRFYYGVFGQHLPDLNLRNPAVTAEFKDVARFWLDDVGIDGFRLDAIKHLIEDRATQVNTAESHAWLRDFRGAVGEVDPGAMLVGEVYDLSEAAAAYVPEDVDLVFDFGLAQATIDSIRRGDASALNAARTESASLFGPGEAATFLTNHDQDRIASQLREEPAAVRLAAGLLLTQPGVPFIYYGEEIGLTGRKPDERIRAPMAWEPTASAAGFSSGTPWEDLDPGWNAHNVAGETTDPGSLLSAYRDVIRLRADHPALRSGATFAVDTAATDGTLVAGVSATLRIADGETVLIVANLASKPVTDYRLSLAASPACGTATAQLLYGGGTASSPTLMSSGGFTEYQPVPSLPPRSITVIALKP